MKRIVLDFETRSACDLKKAGAYKYSLHPTTRPTCLAWKEYGVSTTYLLRFETINQPFSALPEKVQRMWRRFIEEGFEFSAHNAFFETCIYKNVLVARYGWPDIPFERFRCTAAKAAACALPRNLEGAGEAMRLTTQKDKMGYVAMMATCKPTKQWNAWRVANEKVKSGARVADVTRRRAAQPEPPMFLEYDANPEIWEALYKYCKIDVKTEELLDESLPDLIPTEQEIWFLNQRLNWRGLRVDIPTVKKIVDIMAIESKKKLKELDALTMGLVTKPGARKSILEFLALDDIILPDIRAKTIEDVLKEGKLGDDMRRLLEIRQQLSKTSTKKYQGFLDRALDDERIRDILLYHGASTGRDTGTGVQPHNFPRGVIYVGKDRPYAAVENVIECDYELLQLLYGDSLALVFSSILRNMLLPSKGHELFVADFSKIEVAVLWWLAGNEAGLKVLSEGKDPYIYMASSNTGKSYEDIEKLVEAEEKEAMNERQLGKAQVLGCGFGMGWRKFQKTAFDQYRLKLTSGQSRKAVRSYREANDAVPAVWKLYEDAALEAVKNPGQKFKAGKCTFVVEHGFLWIKLPSERKLAYRDPELTWRVFEYEVEEVKIKGKWYDQKALRETFDLDLDDVEEHEAKSGKSYERRFVTKQSDPRETVQFWGLDKTKKKLAPETTFGGRITENIVQAVARDLLMQAIVRLEAKDYRVLLTVHDEAICEKKKGKGSVEEFTKILCQRPAWADKSLPLDAKGWSGERYRK